MSLLHLLRYDLHSSFMSGLISVLAPGTCGRSAKLSHIMSFRKAAGSGMRCRQVTNKMCPLEQNTMVTQPCPMYMLNFAGTHSRHASVASLRIRASHSQCKRSIAEARDQQKRQWRHNILTKPYPMHRVGFSSTCSKQIISYIPLSDGSCLPTPPLQSYNTDPLISSLCKFFGGLTSVDLPFREFCITGQQPHPCQHEDLKFSQFPPSSCCQRISEGGAPP